MKLNLHVQVKQPQAEAFDSVVEELKFALEKRQIDFKPGKEGSITENGVRVGAVTEWSEPNRFSFRWKQADWIPELESRLAAEFKESTSGTEINISYEMSATVVSGEEPELTGWFTDQIFAELVSSISPVRFGDWYIDRTARKPSGSLAMRSYSHPVYHIPNFMEILRLLHLQPNDKLVEIGCGGGSFMKEALKSGCTAAAIDHSPEMIHVATENNLDAIKAGRLLLKKSDAETLQFADSTFTCAVSTGVFDFITDPVKAMKEIHRVLSPSGRAVIFLETKELRGTPAAPEPHASRMKFYEPDELIELAKSGGFRRAEVVSRSLREYAVTAGVPEEHLWLYEEHPGNFLVARKD